MTTHDNKWSVLKKRMGGIYIISFVIISAIASDIFVNRLIVRDYLNEQKISVTQKLGIVRARFEERLNANLYIMFGLAAYISTRSDISEEEFLSISHFLLKQSSLLKNIAAAPDFVIRYLYPLEGNEKILGLDYRKTPEQWPLAIAAKESGKMVIAGPLELVQGGMGVIARIPVFVEKTGQFWGLVSSVIDFDILMEQSGVTSQESDLNIAIRCGRSKKDLNTIFSQNANLFSTESLSVIMPITLPSVSWEMAAIPKNGWISRSPHRVFVHLFFSIAAFIIGYILLQRITHKQMIEENEARLKAMSKASHDSLIMINSDDKITFWNPSAERIFGYNEAEILGRTFHDIITLPADMKRAKKGLKNFSKTGEGPIMHKTRELQAVRKSGEVFPVELAVSSFRLSGTWYAVGSVRDITERKKHDERLIYLATTDELTQLYNRRYFLTLSEMEFKKAIRYEKNFNVAIFDIDHFKNINDTYGHDAGDQVLREISQTMKETVRATDIVGRIGGEEFALTMPETPLEDAKKIAERLRLNVMQMRVQTDKKFIYITISIGIAEIRPPINSLSELIKKADEALYKAKNNGRNQVVSASSI